MFSSGINNTDRQMRIELVLPSIHSFLDIQHNMNAKCTCTFKVAYMILLILEKL